MGVFFLCATLPWSVFLNHQNALGELSWKLAAEKKFQKNVSEYLPMASSVHMWMVYLESHSEFANQKWDKVFKVGLSTFFKDCLLQNLPSPLLNALSHKHQFRGQVDNKTYRRLLSRGISCLSLNFICLDPEI